MDTATLSTVNIILDFVLVLAAIWMIIAVRGVVLQPQIDQIMPNSSRLNLC